jgi:hypothetical protein
MKQQRKILVLSSVLLLSFTAAIFAQGTGRGAASTSGTSAEQRRLKITLDGKQVVTAALVPGDATEEFLTKLPVTFNMTEHLNRQKEIYLPFKLSDRSQQNTVYEYAIGDIVYWHPGPTMGIFHSHDGRRISSGVQVIARLDSGGVTAFKSYPANVSVKIELETGGSTTGRTTVAPAVPRERQLKITLDRNRVITATLVNSPLADEFITKLPITLNMTDYLKREKHGGLSFSLRDSNLTNVQKEYAIGDIIYYPPGPTFAMYYAHDGRVISAGMEVIARLDAEGIRTLATFPANVRVTVELVR